jgi:uncharacterized membrane protein
VKLITRLFLKGLAVILPIGLTFYLLWRIGSALEEVIGGMLKKVLPPDLYVNGLGVVAGFTVILFVGLLTKSYLAQRLIDFGEHVLRKIPIVKTIYGALRDAMSMFASDDPKRELGRAVLVKPFDGNTRLLGFLTRDDLHDLAHGPQLDGVVAVYIPLAYCIGGYTLLVPRTSIELVEISGEDALRFAVTAGMSKFSRRPPVA